MASKRNRSNLQNRLVYASPDSFARGNKKKQKDDEDDNDFMNIMVKIHKNIEKVVK